MNASEKVITSEQQLVIQTAYDVFRERGEWPTHQYVDDRVRRQTGIALWDILRDFPVQLLRQPVPFAAQERVQVRVQGLSYSSNAASDLSLFLRALAWLVRRRQAFQPEPTTYQDLQVTADEFRLENFPLGYGPTDVEFTKMYDLLMGEPLGLGGNPGQFAGNWTLFVPPDMLDLAGITTVEHYREYLTRRFPIRSLRPNEQAAALQTLLSPEARLPQVQGRFDESQSLARSRVFIVHGHDEETRAMVYAYLQELGVQPIVLQDQPNLGRTIIEKVEQHADVDYAVVLFTPDDVGRKALSDQADQARARQNVIFELGFFIGTLGRNKVCLLYRRSTEIPSDLQGVAYVSLENDIWREELVREMRGAGVEVSYPQGEHIS
jgi:predicted nucleotide-binding protein